MSPSATGVAIRPYTLFDLDALYRICLQTGAAGEDATDLTDDPMLLGHVYAAPYAIYEPTLAFVAEDDEGVAGYALAAADRVDFERRLEESWWPPLRERYPRDGEYGDMDRWLVDLLYDRDVAYAVGKASRGYPSELHIDLLPRLQRTGTGRRLMETLLRALRDAGSTGVHFGVAATNDRAIGFYSHLGFERDPDDDGIAFLMRL